MPIIHSKIIAAEAKVSGPQSIITVLQDYYRECLPGEQACIMNTGYYVYEVSLGDGDIFSSLYINPRSSSGISFMVFGLSGQIDIASLNVFAKRRGKGLGTRLLTPLLRYYRENHFQQITLISSRSAKTFWLKQAERNPDINFNLRG
ncbi:hypothetical protein NO2_1409 [Candidatus Termititenax persephonae]|uniref:N-acetyltransferase domain-containing protein n=1 Tax=Candidatus Termititenax persephonae TaxID=2218525 RepID=A0A388TIA6_9BACT|nr:hypothetical protein NO2_1409 [Candidatus Termititenax persephonae]